MAKTKDRILETTAELFRQYGYTGTGIKQIVANASAPFGSIYHFFPGGKEQLAEEVIRRAGPMYLALFEAIYTAAPDPASGVRDFFRGAAEVLRQTDYADACPIAVVALEVAGTSEALRQATADVFESWIAGAAGHLEAAGIDRAEARRLAVEIIAALEGAFVLSRAMKTTEAVDVAGEAAAAAVAASLPAVKPARRKTRAG